MALWELIHMSLNSDFSFYKKLFKPQGKVGLPDEKKMSDQRQTHEVFVELDELEVHDNHLIWKERYWIIFINFIKIYFRARWIKFEEDVEDNDRWSKPHIASLSFLALWEVRKGSVSEI